MPWTSEQRKAARQAAAKNRKPVEPCEQCGQPHATRGGLQACIRHISGATRPEKAGQACSNPPMKGQRVCKDHGGLSPQAILKARDVILEEQAEKLARRWAVPVTIGSYSEALLRHIEKTAGIVAWYQSKVDSLTDDEMIWGLTREKQGGDDWGTTKEARAHVWVQLHEKWHDKLTRMYIEAVKIGLDERRIQLAQQEADAFVRALDGIVAALGHNPNDPQVAGVVERHLRMIEGGAAAS